MSAIFNHDRRVRRMVAFALFGAIALAFAVLSVFVAGSY